MIDLTISYINRAYYISNTSVLLSQNSWLM